MVVVDGDDVLGDSVILLYSTVYLLKGLGLLPLVGMATLT